MALSFQDKIKPKVATTSPELSSLSFADKIKPKTATAPTEQPQGGMVGNILKSIVTAPATMIARPFQAAQSAVQLAGTYGNKDKAKRASELNDEAYRLALKIKTARPEEKQAIKSQVESLLRQATGIANGLSEDASWAPSAGGIVAEAPKNFSDVKKDVGRGIQTVALGVPSAPITAGAAFGFGSSLEQGNDVFSVDTLTNTLVGMGLGKATELLGKPLLNAAGKVIGTITPKILKDLTSKGAGAVQNFMKHHEIIGGTLKPVSEKITSVAQNIDDKIVGKTKSIFSGAKSAIKSQYPDADRNITKHFEDIEINRMMPDKKGVYNKSREVVAEAQRKGVDIKQKLKDNKVYAEEHVINGKYNTKATAEALANEAKNGGSEFIRPALRAADPGVPRTNISEVRNQMISEINKQPSSVLSAEQKKDFILRIAKEYGDDSAEALMYKNGYGLEDLYNSKLQRTSGLYKTPKSGGTTTISDKLTSKQKEIEARIFDRILRNKSPKELKIDDYFKAQEDKFVLANYLKTIHNTKAPQTRTQRIFRKVTQLTGGTLGYRTFGPMGMFNGYQFGGIMADTFASIPNPVKVSYLRSIGKQVPEIYNIMTEFVSKEEAARLIRPLLNPGSKVDAAWQGLKNERGAVEMGYTPKPADAVSNKFNQNSIWLNNIKMIGAPSPRIITPNKRGTPNPYGRPYPAGGEAGPIGGISQIYNQG